MRPFLWDIIKVLLFVFLPFIVLIRSSIFFFETYHWSPWATILAGAGVTAFILIIYFSWIYRKLTGRIGDSGSIKRRGIIAFLVVLIYCLNGVLFINSKHLKNPSLHNELTEVHPIIRLSISTLIYIDKELIITDASRSSEDYDKMGLSQNARSLHYKQKSTNYVHALDIRTNGRAGWKNSLIQNYFRLMGFNTLRHVGTADHLHISINSRDNPGAR